MNKLQLYSQIFKNMGWDYVKFRSFYELKRKTGLLKKQYPVNPSPKSFISLKDWKETQIPFFFNSKKDILMDRNPDPILKEEFEKFQSGELRYFNATYLNIGKNYDWITNPSNGYKYDINKHWTEVEDIATEAGDIKYTWEKSRFSFLHTIIRYDYHFNEDCSELVFKEIDSWISSNPINQGPNYKCSQEISLRVLNWIFALYYYKEEKSLTEERFNKIMHYIYWQLKHDYKNINFSRKAVRNNHAVTETLMLYLAGLLFPFFPESEEWKRQGKKWFEQEIAYQVYEDGTFLQFSHNYHRVLIQLLTWGFYLAEIHGEEFNSLTYKRAKKSLEYLYQCTDPENGELPNYGANDGALFFKLNNRPYRDYRPQLNALYYFFNHEFLFEEKDSHEDVSWLSSQLRKSSKKNISNFQKKKIVSYEKGGCYIIRDEKSFSFIRCGEFKDRPSHADALHLDIWVDGINLLRDAGTYKYNTSQDLVRYFNGTKSHNTVTLGDNDQMLKGPRFIWLNWSELVFADLVEEDDYYVFKGKIKAFKYLGENIFHQRIVRKQKNKLHWEIEDELTHDVNLPMIQYWNTSAEFNNCLKISSFDEKGESIKIAVDSGYYSGMYGLKEKTEVISFTTDSKKIKTIIQAI